MTKFSIDLYILSSIEIQYGSFKETLMHFLRGNIGAGVFGMGAAFKHGGIIFSPIVTIFIAILSLRNQHVLVSRVQKDKIGAKVFYFRITILFLI